MARFNVNQSDEMGLYASRLNLSHKIQRVQMYLNKIDNELETAEEIEEARKKVDKCLSIFGDKEWWR